jgi:hypothetical protein
MKPASTEPRAIHSATVGDVAGRDAGSAALLLCVGASKGFVALAAGHRKRLAGEDHKTADAVA